MTDLLQAWVERLDHGGNGLIPKVQALIKESHTHQQLVERVTALIGETF